MFTIIYYISGHGYGHATRSGEIIRALLAKQHDIQIHIRSNISPGIFMMIFDARVNISAVNLDVGTVQKDSFHVDKHATLQQVLNHYHRKDDIVKREVAYLKTIGADLVVADIPPLAFDVAEVAGLPAIGVANFSWDWIYRDYLSEIPAFSAAIENVSASYRKASLLLRLPFHGDLSVFRKIKDIPLLARKANKQKNRVLNEIGIPPDFAEKLVLIAFRAADLSSVKLQNLENCSGVTFVTIGVEKRFHNQINLTGDVPEFTNILAACDAVVSKPGYGLVSEVIANKTPLLFTEREDFAEYNVLVEGLSCYAVAEFLSSEDFFSGMWRRALHKLFDKPAVWRNVDMNGAEKAAEQIMMYLET